MTFQPNTPMNVEIYSKMTTWKKSTEKETKDVLKGNNIMTLAWQRKEIKCNRVSNYKVARKLEQDITKIGHRHEVTQNTNESETGGGPLLH